MAPNVDRLHLVLGVLLVLGVGYRVVVAPRSRPAVVEASRAGADRPRGAAPRVSRTRPAAPDSLRRAPSAGGGPRREETPVGSRPWSAAAPGQDALARVDVDAADAVALDALPGVGPALAARIVEERRLRGKFQSLEGLQRVRGIGPALAQRLAPYVTFGGTGRPSHVNSPSGGSDRTPEAGSSRGRRRSRTG